jgi:hypothetical protein
MGDHSAQLFLPRFPIVLLRHSILGLLQKESIYRLLEAICCRAHLGSPPLTRAETWSYLLVQVELTGAAFPLAKSTLDPCHFPMEN